MNTKTNRIKSKNPHQNGRPTIGLLIDNTWDPIAWDVWNGVDDTARKQNTNLLCFAGGALRSRLGYLAQANVLYDLVSAEIVDGLVVWGGGLGQFVSAKEVQVFCEQYRPLPMACAALPLPRIPSILVNNYQGMRSVVMHLVQVHRYRRIAFIRGPEGHPEANDRYRAYTDVLAEQELPFEPKLIAPGDFHPDSGKRAISLLLDQYKLRPGTDFEAVVAIDDAAAIGAIEALQARGIQVPGDVAVAGFDNTKEGRYITPPLTTGASLAYKQARRATEIVLELVEGKKAPKHVLLPTQVVVRQSCGCLATTVAEATTGTRDRSGDIHPLSLATQREAILVAMVQSVEHLSAGPASEDAKRLGDAFIAESEGKSPGNFLSTLDEVLRREMAIAGDVTTWQGAISALRHHALPCLGDEETLSRAEDLWQQARVMIGETAQRAQAHTRIQAERQAQAMNAVSQALITTFDEAGLANVAAQGLANLGIESAYISLYEDPSAPAEWANLIMAYGEQGRIQLETGGRRFPSRQLVPKALLPRDRRYSMVIEPLFFQEDQLGFAMFEVGPRKAAIYDALRGHISSALQAIRLLQARKQAEKETQRRATQAALIYKVGQRVSSKLELEELLSAIVTTICDTFGYYTVGLMLLDEKTESLTLKAIAGHYTKHPPTKDLRFAIGEGMVGHAAATGESQISNNVSQNPHYVRMVGEETQSELTVPLKSGQEVIGVLDLQSDTLDAFDDIDVAAMEALGTQVVTAIENARLFEESHSRARELAVLNELGQALTTRLSVEEVLEEAYRGASRLVDTTDFHIGLYDPEKHEIVFQTSEEGTGKFTMSADKGISGYIIRNKTPVLVKENMDQWQEERGLERVGNTALSWLGAPLMVGDRVLGVMFTQNFASPHFFDEHARDLLISIANQAAIALQNAYLFEETHSRANRLAVVNRIAKAASATLRLDELLETVYEEINPTFQADAFFIALYDEKENELDFCYLVDKGTREPPVRHPLGVGLTSTVITEKKPLIIRNEQEYIRLQPSAQLFGTMNPPASWLGVPMLVGERIIGVINVQSYRANAWDEEDELLLLTIADQVAVGIENAHLYETVQQELAERKRAEKALEQKARELANSNAELRQFAHIASHHLQEPLRTVTSYTQLLAKRYRGKLDTDAEEFIGYTVDGAKRIKTLIQDLLDYQQLDTQSKPFQPTDCSTILNRTLARLESAIKDTKATVTHGSLPTVLADATQLEQVFYHLVDNAIRFRSDRPLEIHIEAEQKDNAWSFSVRDNGIGIEPQYFERIFMIFQQLHTDQEYPGTGIGLAVCKKIVERHGGRIWVESEPGQGSTFYFTVPDRKEDAT